MKTPYEYAILAEQELAEAERIEEEGHTGMLGVAGQPSYHVQRARVWADLAVAASAMPPVEVATAEQLLPEFVIEKVTRARANCRDGQRLGYTYHDRCRFRGAMEDLDEVLSRFGVSVEQD